MTASELRELPLDKLFEFTLYYGEKAYGFPHCENNDWYIVNNFSNPEMRKKVLPAQIEEFKILTDQYFFQEQF